MRNISKTVLGTSAKENEEERVGNYFYFIIIHLNRAKTLVSIIIMHKYARIIKKNSIAYLVGAKSVHPLK